MSRNYFVAYTPSCNKDRPQILGKYDSAVSAKEQIVSLVDDSKVTLKTLGNYYHTEPEDVDENDNLVDIEDVENNKTCSGIDIDFPHRRYIFDFLDNDFYDKELGTYCSECTTYRHTFWVIKTKSHVKRSEVMEQLHMV